MSSPWARMPGLKIQVKGRSLDRLWYQALEGVQVRARLGLPTQCELQLDGRQLGKLSPRDWAMGTPIRVSISNRQGDSELFEGELAGVEQSYPPVGGRKVNLRAYDPLFRLHTRQSVRGLKQMTPAELARELVSDLGLSVEPGDSGAARRWIVQHRQTDMELLREHTETQGLFAVVRGKKLHLLTLEGSKPCIELEQGSSLLECRFDAVGSGAWAGVTGFGWDPATGSTVDSRVSRPRSGRKVAWSRSGRKESMRSLVDLGLEDARQVEQAAQAVLDRSACGEISLWGVADGDVRLQPGCAVRIRGVDASLEGQFVLTAVRHGFDRLRGFVTEISSYPPRPMPAPTATSIVPGSVTSVKDPEDLGRVRATLPTLAGFETDWMRVVSPGLGKNRGFVAVPDVGDQVAVALTHGDPARGLVLGGIFDGRGSLDSGVEGGRVRRFQIRAGEQRLTLDEKRGAARIENKKGSYVELAPDGIKLHAAGDLTLEAPGKSLCLKAKRIDMEKA